MGGMGGDLYPGRNHLNPAPCAFGHAGAGVSGVDSKEAVLARSGIIWTVVGVLLIIALLIYIF
jgi:hypothetical protein